MDVKNIIFDLGGVLLNLNFNAMSTEFKKLGIHYFDQIYSKANQTDLFSDFEIGKISPQDFRDEIRKIAGLNINDNNIDLAWNKILLDFPVENKILLENLKLKYRLFLLSNTNDIHIECFQKNLTQQYGLNILDSIFEKSYYSSQIGKRKPNADAFEWVLSTNDLLLNETIFIDDSAHHVEGALKMGLKAHWLDLSKHTTVNFVTQELQLLK